jgi:UDP-N-acetylglucosamine--N-acetylmuramyl-(pentapeptide) pyrophosphoryl-undecaprenol N-acetylglucosamine transferase
LIPYPYAAEDHQSYNARVFADAGAGLVCRQAELTSELLESQVLKLLKSPELLAQMAEGAGKIAIADSAEQLAAVVHKSILDFSQKK